jgi:ribosomal protein S3
VTDDSAFKKRVRARMAETGEKYTAARRMAEAEAAEDAAIVGEVRRGSIGPAAGVRSVTITRTPDLVRVTVRAVRPIVLAGYRGAEADRLRRELEELTGKRVRLEILEAHSAR